MIEQYELYCLADALFYDRPAQRSGQLDFPACDRPVPDGWAHQPSDTWMYYAPVDRSLPVQGWKIHVSASLDDARRVLDTVWDYCTANGLAFKFLRSKPVLVMFNSKSAFRGSSGKLVTIYPADQDQLQTVLAELDELLRGVAGPYILSDLRYGDGPLFVRYGGFAERHCIADNGERVLALEDGDGRLVPDVRGPTFALPPWVTLPEFLQPHLAARNSIRVDDLPYKIEKVLHFSNGGGVYQGHDTRTGERVVLKEGRPYAGLDSVGRDAVTRIGHERDILERLAGLDVVPAVHDYFVLGDHHFLVQEFIDGNPLQRMLVHRYPLTHPDGGSPAALAEYAEWALGMVDRVDAAVAALHERGVVFGDLHPSNILLTADDRMVLIDFEVASLATDRARSALAHPAFQPPADRLGTAADRYALACLRLGMFAPQATMMLPLHRTKAIQLAEVITRTFPVPPLLIADAVDTILGPEPGSDAAAPESDAAESDTAADAGQDPVVVRALRMPPDADWRDVRSALRTAILASATPERDDRLFPGDIAQAKPGGGINFAYGAAGVLWALAVTGAGRHPEHETWLRTKALDPGHGAGVGFYDGLHGVAYALDVLGHRQDALDTVDLGLRQEWESRELGLFSGLAGIGLNLLHFADATGEPAFAELAQRTIDIVAERMGGPDDVPTTSGGNNPRAGLMYGSAGPALLFLRGYERTGEARLLDLAAVALRQDLRRCTAAPDGTVQVDQGWRTLPYLDEGSVGIGLVLARYLAHRGDDAFATALTGMRLTTRCGYFVQPGLFTGRAGMIAGSGMWSRADGTNDMPDARTAAERNELIRGLSWHALPYGGGLAFPGDQLLRLSMDLATGAAGVLLALGTALHEQPVYLPFFDPPAGPHHDERFEAQLATRGGVTHGSS